MLDWNHLRDARSVLKPPLEALLERAARTDRRHYFAVRCRVSPRDWLTDFLASPTRDAFFWQEPSRGTALLGLGRVAVVEETGPGRFQRASERCGELLESVECISLTSRGTIEAACAADAWRGPLLFGGFGFYDAEPAPESEWQGFGPGRLVLPELGVARRGDEAWMTRVCAVHPGDRADALLDRLVAAAAERTSDDPGETLHRRLRGDVRDEDLSEHAPVHRDLGPTLGEGTRGPEIRVQSDRSHGRYMAQIEAALEAIEAGKFEKVVLARSLTVGADEDYDLHAFLASLREIYPSCATVAIREGEHLFVSATPERLVALEGGAVETVAVAGSAPRGRSPEEEAQYSNGLLGSAKEREEHEVVKRSIRTALAGVCGELEGQASPSLLKLEGIQHLATPLSGRLMDGMRHRTNVLDLVGRLHPTPAVGGAPSSAALDWLERFEGLDRGWYAGPIGHLDASGNGEFRVALRSGLLRGRTARLFAGAGIVAGSDPRSELAETRLKLRALLAPLTEI